MDATHLLGPVAGGFGVIMGLAPLLQVARVVRRRSSDDLAVMPLVIVVIGTSLWLSYGLAAADMTLVVANVVSTTINALALATVLRFRGSRRQEASYASG